MRQLYRWLADDAPAWLANLIIFVMVMGIVLAIALVLMTVVTLVIALLQ